MTDFNAARMVSVPSHWRAFGSGRGRRHDLAQIGHDRFGRVAPQLTL